MRISNAWFQTLTSPFPPLDEMDPFKQFKPEQLVKKFGLGTGKALRLAQVMSFWTYTLERLDLPEAMHNRLYWCTMRFSHWRIKYRRRCDRAKICPWCRQRLVLHLYSNLTNLAQRGRLGVLVNRGAVEDRKKLSRAPGGSLAVIRNVVYPHRMLMEPEFVAVFFSKLKAGSPAVPCSNDDLKVLLSGNLSWSYWLMMSHNRPDYLELLQGTRLWSLNT